MKLSHQHGVWDGSFQRHLRAVCRDVLEDGPLEGVTFEITDADGNARSITGSLNSIDESAQQVLLGAVAIPFETVLSIELPG